MSARDAIFSRLHQHIDKGDTEARRAVVQAPLEHPKTNLIPARGEGDIAHRIAVFTRYMEAVGGSVEVLDDLNDRREINYLRTLLENPQGTGADRQIALYKKTGSVHAVTQFLMKQTMEGIELDEMM